MSDYSSISFKNNGKLKLLIIVGTRPEIIRLAAVINKTRKYFDVILAHTGQNYDYNLNGVFFHDLQLADPEVYAAGNKTTELLKKFSQLKESSEQALEKLGELEAELAELEAQRAALSMNGGGDEL